MQSDERQKIIDFLVPYEKFCVTLLGEVLAKSPSIYVVKGNFGEIHGVFSWWQGSAIRHCLPTVYSKTRLELERAFEVFFREHTLKFLFSVVGEFSGTQMLLKLIEEKFSKKPTLSIDYNLMENNRFDSKKNLLGINTQMEFSICDKNEIDRIFPIQAAYEKEEVVLTNEKFDDDSSRAKFENFVEAKAVYLGKINGVCLSKATITTRAKNYVMLGGVYTVPKYRKHGLAKALVNHICTQMDLQGKKITLFVKKENSVALRLYESCGFKTFCDYKIVYYFQ